MVTITQIKQLVELHPNDMDLGKAVRGLIKNESINEVNIDPMQVDLFNSINEITKQNGFGTRL